jgi:hypothetical protein
MKIPETIPKIRIRLHEIAEERGIPELAELAEATKRRPPVRKAPTVSARITPALSDAVRAYCAAFPHLPEHEVSRFFQLNQGRVSEILRGKRK